MGLLLVWSELCQIQNWSSHIWNEPLTYESDPLRPEVHPFKHNCHFETVIGPTISHVGPSRPGMGSLRPGMCPLRLERDSSQGWTLPVMIPQRPEMEA